MVDSGEPVGVMTSGVGVEPVARALRCDGPSGSRGAVSSPQSQREALGISETTSVVIDDDDLRMSMGLYEFFMVNNASDAMRVYLHLFYTARRQQNRSVWANTKYIAKGSGMGQGRVKVAKAWLAEKGVIEYRQDPLKAGRGKSKVYILLRTRLSGGTGIRTPDNQDTCSPTHEVLREKEKYQENKKSLPVATLPAKPTPYRVFSDLFEERSGQKWSIDGKKEGVQLAALVKWAKEMASDDWQHHLRSFMDGAWALIHGDVLGLKNVDREWWMSKPYTPSMLRALRAHIVAMMIATKVNNTASPEYMAQLEKDWGAKIRKREALEAR